MASPAILQSQSTDTKLGDANVLSAARIEVRKNFESNRHLQTGTEEFQKSIAHANEVAKFLKENVVQGEATEGDNYSTAHGTLGQSGFR